MKIYKIRLDEYVKLGIYEQRTLVFNADELTREICIKMAEEWLSNYAAKYGVFPAYEDHCEPKNVLDVVKAFQDKIDGIQLIEEEEEENGNHNRAE